MMKILVVDDEHDVKILFEQRFRREIHSSQIEFAFAYGGEEALRYLELHDHEVVLILSDINMPGMSGLELLRLIKQKYTSPPQLVMMITAYADTDNYKLALQLGAAEFLTKPLDFTLLKEKLQILMS